MNTRFTSDKAEVDNFYKTAIKNQGKINPCNAHRTLRTSTPIEFSKPKSIVIYYVQ